MQQSAAFKILQTRLKTVPSYAFSGEQLKRSSSGNPYTQILHINDDGNRNQDDNAINFASRLQQFEHMQHRHRIHAKSQLQSRTSASSTVTQVWKIDFLIVIVANYLIVSKFVLVALFLLYMEHGGGSIYPWQREYKGKEMSIQPHIFLDTIRTIQYWCRLDDVRN